MRVFQTLLPQVLPAAAVPPAAALPLAVLRSYNVAEKRTAHGVELTWNKYLKYSETIKKYVNIVFKRRPAAGKLSIRINIWLLAEAVNSSNSVVEENINFKNM